MDIKYIKRLVIIVILALSLTPSIAWSFDEWAEDDIAREIVFTGLIIVDWLQTHQISSNPNKIERNPILGHEPSHRRINLYFGICTIGKSLISHMLPSKYRSFWQNFFIGSEHFITASNYQYLREENIGMQIVYTIPF